MDELVPERRVPNFGTPAHSEAAAPPDTEAPVVSSWTPDGEALAPVGEDEVLAAIGTVYDPEIPVNIYELGLIYAVELRDDGYVKVEMTLTAPNCPSAQELPAEVRAAILKLPAVTACDVEVVWEPAWTPDRMSENAKLSLNMF